MSGVSGLILVVAIPGGVIAYAELTKRLPSLHKFFKGVMVLNAVLLGAGIVVLVTYWAFTFLSTHAVTVSLW